MSPHFAQNFVVGESKFFMGPFRKLFLVRPSLRITTFSGLGIFPSGATTGDETTPRERGDVVCAVFDGEFDAAIFGVPIDVDEAALGGGEDETATFVGEVFGADRDDDEAALGGGDEKDEFAEPELFAERRGDSRSITKGPSR
jgi:hypothetical protein